MNNPKKIKSKRKLKKAEHKLGRKKKTPITPAEQLQVVELEMAMTGGL